MGAGPVTVEDPEGGGWSSHGGSSRSREWGLVQSRRKVMRGGRGGAGPGRGDESRPYASVEPALWRKGPVTVEGPERGGWSSTLERPTSWGWSSHGGWKVPRKKMGAGPSVEPALWRRKKNLEARSREWGLVQSRRKVMRGGGGGGGWSGERSRE